MLSFCNIVFRPLATSSDILPIYPEMSIFKSRTTGTICSYQLLIVVYFLELRLWFIYYDVRKNEHLIGSKFGKQFNSKNTKNSQPWTLRYHKTLGNTTFMSILTLLISVSLYTLMAFLRRFPIFSLINILMPVLTLIWIIPLAIISARLKDEIGIGREIRAICMFFVLFVGVYLIGAFSLPEETHHKPRDCYMLMLWGPLLGLIGILRSIHIPSLKLKNDNCLNEILHIYASNCNSTESKHINYIINNKKITLNDILKNKAGFDAFVNHCSKEFSSENILYLIELYDVKTKLINNNIINMDTVQQDHVLWEMILPESLIFNHSDHQKMSPSIKSIQSQSNSNTNIILDGLVEQLFNLYNEYISSNAISIINISAAQKKVILNATEKLNDKSITNDDSQKLKLVSELFLAHMQCGKSVYDLLKNDTWMRFKQTNIFEELSELL